MVLFCYVKNGLYFVAPVNTNYSKFQNFYFLNWYEKYEPKPTLLQRLLLILILLFILFFGLIINKKLSYSPEGEPRLVMDPTEGEGIA